MGRKSSISPEQGLALVEAFKRTGSKSAAAREIKVSEDAAARYLASFSTAATPTVATQQEVIQATGTSLFDATTALAENFAELKLLLIQARANDMANPKAVAAANMVFKNVLDHIEAGTRLIELMVSVDENRKFREAILEVLGEVDESLRQRAIIKLRERRAVGLALYSDR